MPWIVKVDDEGQFRFLANPDEAVHRVALAKVEERDKARRFNTESSANDFASFRGYRYWKVERVEP